MKLSTQSSRILASALLVSLIAACGGGGGDSTPAPAPSPTPAPAPAPTPPAPPPVPYTIADARPVASDGLFISSELPFYTKVEHLEYADAIQVFSSYGAVTNLTNASCVNADGGQGTLSVSFVKSGTAVGFKSGDTISYTFNNCRVGTSTKTFNGAYSVTINGNYANLSPTSYQVNYSVKTTKFEISIANGTTTFKLAYDGSQTATYKRTSETSIEVTAKSDIVNTVDTYSGTSTVPNFSVKLLPTTTVAATQTTGTFASRVDGDLIASGNNLIINYAMSTPVAFSGTIAASGVSTPNAGEVFTTKGKLLTKVTLSANSAILQADSNRDGVLDLSLTTTYADLSK